MAVTPEPLNLDFYHIIPNALNIGAAVEYADTKAQSLYINNGIKTIMTTIPMGHWEGVEYSAPSAVSKNIYDFSSWDHPQTGYLMGTAQNGNDLHFIRYRYRVPGYT